MLNKLKQNLSWWTGAGLLIALLLATGLAVAPAAAANPPSPWETMWLYGTVNIDGASAPAGTTVSVYVDGTLNGSTTVDSSGKYGDSTPFYITGSDGQAVTFQVGSTDAPQSTVFAGGTSFRVNLTIGTTSLSVSTGAATVIGSRIAMLNGNLSNMGGLSPVNVYFRYGIVPTYGSITGSQSRTTTGDFTADLSSLTPSTTYYFQSVATSGSTTVYGGQLTFTTSASTLTVITSASTGGTASAATLNGNLTDLGSNSSVNVYFEYGTTQSFGASTTVQAKTTIGTFSSNISGLLSNTRYYFRSVAVASTTVYGETLNFTTSVGSFGVSTGSATSVSATTATLSGILTGLGSNTSANVYFQYGTTTAYGSTTPVQTQTSVGGFSAPISGLSPNTTYNFLAVATAGSTTVTGANATFTTLASSGGNTTPPNQFFGTVYVDGERTTAGTTVAAYINGSPAASTTTNSAGKYGYANLFYVPSTGSGTVTFYVNGTLAPQTASWASGGVTNLDLTLSGGPCTTAPGAFSLTSPISGANASGTSVNFTWSAAGRVSYYFLQVNTNSSFSGTNVFAQPVGNVNTYTVSGFSNSGTTYYWRVNAYNDCGVTSGTVSDPRFINGGGSCTTIPGAFNLTVPANGGTVTGTPVTFTWTTASGVTDYFLQVNTNPSFPGSGNVFAESVGTVNTRSVSIPNTGTYYWRVNASNACGVRGANLPSFIRN